tara:strand:- start:449 stop:1270 length:822 start_codon:yes stop_codon:yes gene_type:complete
MLIIPLLTLIMFSMGLTLSPNDFIGVLAQKKVLALGIFLQFTIMPLSAFIISLLLNFPTELTVGMVLVGSTSGGTASNVICYLAGANVALSISMTIFSTISASILMPIMTWIYIGQTVTVPVFEMGTSVVRIVFLPVLIGVVINYHWDDKLSFAKPIFPLLSIISIVIVIAIIVSLNQSKIAYAGMMVIIGVILHNGFGMLSGWLITRAIGFDNQTCRTLMIEIGMQNSALSAALAIKYFSAASALPAAIFSIWHNISGSLIAGFWNAQDRKA